jgi:Protein of unknown function (DUF3467)
MSEPGFVGGDEGDERPTEFQLAVPPELEGGVYSNFLGVWHTAYEFTLDFCSTQPAQPVDPEDPNSPAVVPCRVVARVKIPPTLVFNVLQALNENMTNYEATYGPIQRPEEREPPE